MFLIPAGASHPTDSSASSSRKISHACLKKQFFIIIEKQRVCYTYAKKWKCPTFYNIFFYALLAFIVHLLGDFYIIRDHIVIFWFFFSSERFWYLSRGSFLKPFFYLLIFGWWIFRHFHIWKKLYNKIYNKKWFDTFYSIIAIIFSKTFITHKMIIWWVTGKKFEKHPMKITWKNA